MVIFIDESGTHKQSGYAANTIVYVTIEDIEDVENRLRLVVSKLNLNSFHWAEHGWKVREKFLEKVIKLNFRFKVGIFKNPVKTSEMTEIVFQHLITEKGIELVWIDGKQPKWYERRLKKVLRDKGISVRKLRTVRNEASQPGIQLADALAGLSRYYFENPNAKDAKRWYERLKKEDKIFAEIKFEAKKTSPKR